VDAAALFEGLGLRDATLLAQDWGGLIGPAPGGRAPRPVRPGRRREHRPAHRRHPMSEAFLAWQRPRRDGAHPRRRPDRRRRDGARPAARRWSPPTTRPFPDEASKAGARAFPGLVPTTPDDPAAPANRAAWDVLARWDRPFLTAFSDGDPITAGAETWFQQIVPGARGMPHTTLRGGGHFLQEDVGPGARPRGRRVRRRHPR
jgi:haloalkane dehalogenase